MNNNDDWSGLGCLSQAIDFLYNKTAYIRRTLSLKFSTKDIKGWAKTLSGSTSKDEAPIIGSIVDDSVGEDRIPNF